MATNEQMPKENGIDHSIQLLKEGYHFILNRRDKFDSNIFETKLLAEKTICLVGKEAAEIFYDHDKFKRNNAAPKRVEKTLFGEGGVQGLDGADHRNRKGMFMSLMTKEALNETKDLSAIEWEKALADWQASEEKDFVVYEEAKKVLTRVAFQWTGIPLEEDEVEGWAKDLSDLFETPANLGFTHFKGRHSRSKAEDRIEQIVKKVRQDKIKPDPDRALYQFSWHRDTEGNLLDEKIVAVELLNLLRPLVAISIYVEFLVLAVHNYPQEVEKIRTGDDQHSQRFVQEVRRYYPFFPFAAARVKNDFTWDGYEFEEDTLTLLDLYGTNHHPDVWNEPNRFQPDRFKLWEGSPFDFIPQGGGEYEIGHRCAGEWMTVDILKTTLSFFVNEVTFEVPEQDLSYSMTEIPTRPESKVILSNMRHR